MPYFKVPGPLNYFAPFGRVEPLSPIWRQSPTHQWNTRPEHLQFRKRENSGSSDDNLELGMCLNLSSQKFAELIMGLINEAITLSQDRRSELLSWDAHAKKRTQLWFNVSNDEIRDYLLNGINSAIRVFQNLKPENFLDYTEENAAAAGCLPQVDSGADAAVCPTDISERRILIGSKFWELPRARKTFGTNNMNHGNSMLLTLVHEVMHFKDVFGSTDGWYGTNSAIKYASHPQAKITSDNLAGYILGVIN